MPRSTIIVLLLRPNNRLGILVLIKIGFYLGPREGMKLLYSGNGHVLDACRFSMLLDRFIYLSRAENNTLDGFWVLNRVAVLGISDDWLEG